MNVLKTEGKEIFFMKNTKNEKGSSNRKERNEGSKKKVGGGEKKGEKGEGVSGVEWERRSNMIVFFKFQEGAPKKNINGFQSFYFEGWFQRKFFFRKKKVEGQNKEVFSHKHRTVRRFLMEQGEAPKTGGWSSFFLWKIFPEEKWFWES